MKKFTAILLFCSLIASLNAQNVSFIHAIGSPFTNFQQQLGHLSKDINADGFNDLIVGRDGNSLSVFLGSGNGQFTNAPGSPIQISSPISIAAADFNGDNFLDLVTANYNSGNISILLGTGTGSFNPAPGSPINTGILPYCVDAADFNLDGKMDVITVSAGSDNVMLFLGNGAGSFTMAAGFPIASGLFPYHVSSGFFNSDNIPDFAVANGNGNNVSVYLGSQTGLFTQAPGSPFATGVQPRTIAVKDLNSDNFPDMVISNALSNNINVFMGSANGSFSNAPGSPITLNAYPFQSVIEDFNLDGLQDIATVNGQSNNITILYGNGTGMFIQAPGSPITVGNYPHSLCSADFDNDGRTDLATGDWTGNKMNILINKTISINTSLSGLNSQNQINVAPNPTSGMLNITTGNLTDKMELIIYNVSGQQESRFEINSDYAPFNLQNLTNGTYYYVLSMREKFVKSGQIVLNK